MASTVSRNKDADEYVEYIDSDNSVRTKILELARLMRKHRGNIIFFTGAGISTGAGIPDFRSGMGSKSGMPCGKYVKC